MEEFRALKVAVTLNKTAVASLRYGKQEEALVMLHLALSNCVGITIHELQEHFTQQILSTAARLEPDLRSRIDTSGNCRMSPLLQSVSSDPSRSTAESLSSMDLTASPSNSFTLFDRPLMVGNEDPADLSVWVKMMPYVPSILLYNIGLAHHRLAIKCRNVEEYAKAMQLYDLSICLLEEVAVSGSYNSEFNLLLLALFNNLGHINSHFFNEQATTRYRDQCLAVLTTTDYSRLLTKDEFTFFSMNLFFVLFCWPPVAPAA